MGVGSTPLFLFEWIHLCDGVDGQQEISFPDMSLSTCCDREHVSTAE